VVLSGAPGVKVTDKVYVPGVRTVVAAGVYTNVPVSADPDPQVARASALSCVELKAVP